MVIHFFKIASNSNSTKNEEIKEIQKFFMNYHHSTNNNYIMIVNFIIFKFFKTIETFLFVLLVAKVQIIQFYSAAQLESSSSFFTSSFSIVD